MHPIMSTHAWIHAHRTGLHPGSSRRLSHWLHNDRLLNSLVMIAAFVLMFLVVYLTLRFGAVTTANMIYTDPSYLWMH